MIKYYKDIIQRSPEWYAARCGLLTASEMRHIITPAKLQYAQNDKEKTHLYELLAQRINNYVEPTFQSFDMMRGQDDESRAREAYNDKYGKVDMCGFMVNDKWGFPIGYSPDGLVDFNRVIEAKSRLQKYQLETILTGEMPPEFMLQVQTGLLVSERERCDFISYCGGMPMLVIPVMEDKKIQLAIVAAATIFYEKLATLNEKYDTILEEKDEWLTPTERHVEKEIHV